MAGLSVCIEGGEAQRWWSQPITQFFHSRQGNARNHDLAWLTASRRKGRIATKNTKGTESAGIQAFTFVHFVFFVAHIQFAVQAVQAVGAWF